MGKQTKKILKTLSYIVLATAPIFTGCNKPNIKFYNANNELVKFYSSDTVETFTIKDKSGVENTYSFDNEANPLLWETKKNGKILLSLNSDEINKYSGTKYEFNSNIFKYNFQKDSVEKLNQK